MAGLATGQTPERQAALRSSAKAIYAKAGLGFMDALVDPIFDRQDGGEILQAFDELARHVSPERRLSIVRTAHRDTKAEGGVDTVEKHFIDAAVPKLHQDLRSIVADAKATADVSEGTLDYEGVRKIVERQKD